MNVKYESLKLKLYKYDLKKRQNIKIKLLTKITKWIMNFIQKSHPKNKTQKYAPNLWY